MVGKGMATLARMKVFFPLFFFPGEQILPLRVDLFMEEKQAGSRVSHLSCKNAENLSSVDISPKHCNCTLKMSGDGTEQFFDLKALSCNCASI